MTMSQRIRWQLIDWYFKERGKQEEKKSVTVLGKRLPYNVSHKQVLQTIILIATERQRSLKNHVEILHEPKEHIY
jgi:hypothetical protein